MTRPWRTRRGAVAVTCCAAQLVVAPVRAQEPTASPSPPEAPTAAAAPDQAAALAHFREGKQRYGERRYAEAAEAFARSLAAAWSIEAAYNMALSLDRASDLVAALQAYRAYLERADVNDEHRATALERSELLRQRVGEVQLQIDSIEAIREIRINGAPVATSAFPWLTLPGPLEVEFVGEAPGQRRTIRADVRPGGTATIVFPGFVGPIAVPSDRPGPPVAPAPKVEPRQRALRTAFWTTASLAAAGGVTVAVLGSLTLVYKERVEAGCDGICAEGELPDRRDTFHDLRAATNVAIPIAVALGVTAIALGVVWRRERSRSPASTRAGLRWLGPAVELTF